MYILNRHDDSYNEPTFCAFPHAHKGLACSQDLGGALTDHPRFNPHKLLVVVNKTDCIIRNHTTIPPVFIVLYMQARLHKRPVLLWCHLHQAAVDKISDLCFQTVDSKKLEIHFIFIFSVF